MNKYLPFLFCLCLAFVVCSGCDDAERRASEMRDCPTMKAAQDAERRGDIDKAVELYTEVVAMYPSEALPCLQLGLLLHDRKRDFLGAIYHYRRFIKNAKSFQEQREVEVISNRIEKAKQSVATEMLRALVETSSSPEAQEWRNFQNQNQKIVKLEARNRELEENDKAKEKEIVSLKATVTHLELAIEKMKSSGVAGSGKTISRPGVLTPYEYTDEQGKIKSGMTYQVEGNDNLSRIASKVYGDASMWPRISAANSDKIDKSNTVKAGDILLIPWP